MMCTSCVLALDGVDDGEICNSRGLWHGYASAMSKSPHVRVGTCEVAFVVRCSIMLGEMNVDMIVISVALHMWECTTLNSRA